MRKEVIKNIQIFLCIFVLCVNIVLTTGKQCLQQKEKSEMVIGGRVGTERETVLTQSVW